jgi:hypothetical protein
LEIEAHQGKNGNYPEQDNKEDKDQDAIITEIPPVAKVRFEKACNTYSPPIIQYYKFIHDISQLHHTTTGLQS